MKENNYCSAYIKENGLYGKCKNGFPQITGACMGMGNNPKPVCLNGKLCARLYPETGKPELINRPDINNE